ncbi:MAG TPA: anhydro-N-acetylmuramic acid kinase [Saprospiraceae bacterium]|nr:anhydro-N-acetylmuramic acid kinase [Saprospiraceae bacterium]
MPSKAYRVLGLLSGSSLDGTDVAICKFVIDRDWPGLVREWHIAEAATIPYPDEWITRLKSLPSSTSRDLVIADTELGHYYGLISRDFIQRHGLPIDLIASHGHTIFHFPELKTTTQIGDGAAITAETGIDSVTQLRGMDVAFGAQGAPLAPLGDKYLYPGYSFYLNLGGIANLTTSVEGAYLAFDICPCNQILNALAGEAGLTYDHDGGLAASGKLIPDLLQLYQSDPYLTRTYPKSLDNTWVVENHVNPSLGFNAPTADKLHTAVEFIALEIAKACALFPLPPNAGRPSMFVTGGGALNHYLVTRIQALAGELEVVLPSRTIIEFKEVSFIALAGLFRGLRIPNLFASVTGAPGDTINGALYTNQTTSPWS